MISLLRSHGAGARGARVSSIALLLFFLVLPVSASTRADAARPVPETLPLTFELNAGQTSSDVKFLSPCGWFAIAQAQTSPLTKGGDKG